MSNVRQPKQFETAEQIARTLAELDCSLADARNAVDRLDRLRARLANEFAAIQTEADDLDWQTEEHFAGDLKILPSLLASLRRRFDLPHCIFGRETRYTREQRRRCAEILEVSNSRKGAKAFTRAA